MAESLLNIQPSCDDDFDPNALTCEEAARRIDVHLQPLREAERVPLRSALGRVLATALKAPFAVPGHVNSAMDGYAINALDIPHDGLATLNVVGASFAGKPFTSPLPRGCAVRIMTGAVVPEGADTILPQEQVETCDAAIRLDGRHKQGQHLRAAGEDLTLGSTVLAAGTLVTPAELGLIASLGFAEVDVIRRLRVAFFSTGDELRSLGEPLGLGDIYDSNRYTLYGMLQRLGVEILDLGVVRDERDALAEAFDRAARIADVVITSGGVSVGEADYTKEILTRLGEVRFWKVAMKPGRPLAFGALGDAVFFGLPGNPVSVMVTFYQFVQPALWRLMGTTPRPYRTLKARTTAPLKKRPGRMEFQRGTLHEVDSVLHVTPTGDQGSGILSSMTNADCFILLPMDSGRVDAGTLVDVQPFHALV